MAKRITRTRKSRMTKEEIEARWLASLPTLKVYEADNVTWKKFRWDGRKNVLIAEGRD